MIDYHCAADELGTDTEPKTFVVAPETIEGFEDMWEQANRKPYPTLEYKPGSVVLMPTPIYRVPLWST